MSTTSFAPLPAEVAGVELWRDVVGHDEVREFLRASVDAPVHAYLLVGPHGSGKRDLARAFAAAIVSSRYEGPDAARQAELVLTGKHADVTEFARVGAAISTEQADQIIAVAMRSSIEGGPKVLVLDEFHLVRDAGPKLLKTIEEPPRDTVFLVLADDVPSDLLTIASRCVRVDVDALDAATIAAALVADGVAPDRATEAAEAAAGDLGRARVLATDERLALRRAAWRAVPDRLDGTGGRAVETVDDLLAMIADAMAPLVEIQAAETAELDAVIKASGERGSGRKQLEDRHKREQRRFRADELRAGLTEVERRYRDRLLTDADPSRSIAAIARIDRVAANLVRNPNERLQLVALFTELGR